MWALRRWLTRGKDCPRCGEATYRRPSSALVRRLRPLLGALMTLRYCSRCGWRGMSFAGAIRSRSPDSSPAHRLLRSDERSDLIDLDFTLPWDQAEAPDRADPLEGIDQEL